jgi:hypothetical protein
MKVLTTLINNLFVKQPVVLLGRWNIVYCQEKINKKIDLSNEDHCGTCTSSTFISTTKNNKNKKNKNYDIRKLIFCEVM